MKIQSQKEYKSSPNMVLKSKLNGKNKIQAINTRQVAVMRFGAGVIKWTDNELRTLDTKTRKMLTMYRAFHPKTDVERFYVERAKGWAPINLLLRGVCWE